jgi:hypothetical protein
MLYACFHYTLIRAISDSTYPCALFTFYLLPFTFVFSVAQILPSS